MNTSTSAEAAAPVADTGAPPANDDSFEAAFAAAVAEDEPKPDGGDPVVETPTEPKPEGEQPPAPDPEPKPEGEQPPAPDPEPKPEGEQPPAPAATAPADDVLNRLADLINKTPEAPAAPAAPAAPEAPIYTEEEAGVLADYEKNWTDVSRGETLKRRAEYHDLMKYVFTQVSDFMAPHIETLRTIGNAMHATELRAAVPDYSENLEQDVAKWIDTQPAYLQTAFKQVMQTGTSDEVADLIGRYRAATGTAPAQQAPAVITPPAAPTPPAQPAKSELSSAAKQAAESLAPVSGERSQVPQGEDPQDFETAFSRYAATMD